MAFMDHAEQPETGTLAELYDTACNQFTNADTAISCTLEELSDFVHAIQEGILEDHVVLRFPSWNFAVGFRHPEGVDRVRIVLEDYAANNGLVLCPIAEPAEPLSA